MKADDASPKVDTPQTVPSKGDEVAPDAASKKRSREEDHEPEEAQAAKKLDTKADGS